MASGDGKKKVGGLSTRIAELILVLFNLALLLCGGAVLSFGIIALVDPQIIVDLLTWIPGFSDIQYIIDIAGLLLNNAVILIVIGSIIFAVSFLGCCGTRKSNSCMLTVYWLIVLVVLLFELAMIMWAAIETQKMQDRVAQLMFTTLEENYQPVSIDGDIVRIAPSNESAARAWQTLQYNYSCCGAKDQKDYSKFAWNQSFTVNNVVINATVPPECCLQYTQYEIADRVSDYVDLTACLTGALNSTLARNTEGCYRALITEVTYNSFITTVIIAGLIAAEVIAIMLALCMQIKINKVAPKKSAPSPSVPAPDYD